MNNRILPEVFRDEVLDCIIEEEKKSNPESSTEDAEKKLRSIFVEVSENYDKPTYDALIKSMKILMSWELKSGKDTKTISNNFLKIAKKIKSQADIY